MCIRDSLKAVDFFTRQDQFGATGQLQQIAVGEVDKYQARPGIHAQIAQRIEKQVAGKIRDGQHLFVDTDKTGLAAAMRGVDLPPACIPLGIHIAGDEKGVGSADQGICLGIELRQHFGSTDEGPGWIP